jgi:hypothetical protein
MLAAAPPKIRDAFVERYAKELFHTISMAPVVLGVTAFIASFFSDESRGAHSYAEACLAAIQSSKLIFEWLPKLHPHVKEVIFAEVFREFHLLVISSVSSLRPDLAAPQVCDIMARMRVPVSTKTCDAFVADAGSPLALLLETSCKGDSADDVPVTVSRTILPYVADFLRRASREAQCSFALQNPKAFFNAFGPLGRELPLTVCCVIILQTMREESRRPFLEEHGDMFIERVLFSAQLEIRSAAAEMIAGWCEPFLMTYGVRLIVVFSTCKDEAIRRFIDVTIHPFKAEFVLKYGKEIIEMLLGSTDPSPWAWGIRWIGMLDEFSRRQFLLCYGDSLLSHLGCMAWETPLARQVLDFIESVPGAIPPRAATGGLLHCCLSTVPDIRNFAHQLFQQCDRDLRAQAIEVCLVSIVGSTLRNDLMDQLCSLIPGDAAKFIFGLLNDFLAEESLKPGRRLWCVQKVDREALFGEVAALGSPEVQCGVLSGDLKLVESFAVGLMAAVASRASEPLDTLFIPLLTAFALPAREMALRTALEVLGLFRSADGRPYWEVLLELWGSRVDQRYFDGIFIAVCARWNAMLEGLPVDLVECLKIPTPARG